MQPNDGGEVQFIFSFGSSKYDLFMSGTKFRMVICDDCAEKIIVENKLEPIGSEG